jgi:Fe-S-cluster containining protein
MTVTDQLKQEWFARLERLIAVCEALPPSGMRCLTHCTAMCCPRVKMRHMNRNEIASPVVVLLPFEMEYIIEHVGGEPGNFRLMPVELSGDVSIQVGMLDLSNPCPFLRPDFRCGIYDRRPFDCRTFPLLPRLNAFGHIAWDYGQNCPSLHSINPAFDRQIRAVWEELHEILPRTWWELYLMAEELGCPLPEECDVLK